MRKVWLAFVCIVSLGLFMAQTTIAPKTTVAPKTTLLPHSGGGGGPTVALLQHPNGVWTSGSSISITLTQSIANGSILIFADQTNLTSARVSSINVGGTLVACGASSSCYSGAGGGHGMDTADGGWVLSSTATAGPVVLSYTGGITAGRVEMREYSCTGGTASADTSGYRDSSTDTTPYNGVTLSPTGTNDVIVQWTNVNQTTPDGVNSPYGNFDITGSGEQIAVADLLNSASGTAPVFTAAGNSGGSSTAAIAIKCQ